MVFKASQTTKSDTDGEKNLQHPKYKLFRVKTFRRLFGRKSSEDRVEANLGRMSGLTVTDAIKHYEDKTYGTLNPCNDDYKPNPVIEELYERAAKLSVQKNLCPSRTRAWLELGLAAREIIIPDPDKQKLDTKYFGVKDYIGSSHDVMILSADSHATARIGDIINGGTVIIIGIYSLSICYCTDCAESISRPGSISSSFSRRTDSIGSPFNNFSSFSRRTDSIGSASSFSTSGFGASSFSTSMLSISTGCLDSDTESGYNGSKSDNNSVTPRDNRGVTVLSLMQDN